jgi:hypothetical protein
VLEAWTQGWGRTPGERVLIEPNELERFERTYQPFPPIPPHWKARPQWQAGMPFFLDGRDVKR